MFRNLFAVVVAVLAIWSVGAAADAPKDKTRLVPEVARAQPPYVHAVLFHLKKDAPEGEIEALIRDSPQIIFASSSRAAVSYKPPWYDNAWGVLCPKTCP
jgi:hypothetical protein